jgi:hypothetical protein
VNWLTAVIVIVAEAAVLPPEVVKLLMNATFPVVGWAVQIQEAAVSPLESASRFPMTLCLAGF